MVGVIGPDGVGKSTLLGLIAGVRKIQQGDVVVFDKDVGESAQPQGNPRPHRLHAARARPQSLSDAERVREHRLLRPPVRPGRGGAAGPHHRAPDRDRDGEVRGPPGRQALRRHEAEAQPLLRADQRSRPSHSRRADDRRRSAVARPVLGPHQLHPRAAPADERDRRHRLHGRSRALRLADGDGRRQDHRHRRAEGAARQDGRTQSRRRVHCADAGSQARAAQEGGRAPARRLARRDAGDRGGRADAQVRRLRRRRSRQLQDSAAARFSASSAPTAAASRRR